MEIDWWTLGLQTANLLVLMWLLGRFLFRPLARMVAERQAEAARLLDEAADARAKAEAAVKAAQEQQEAAAAERAGLVESARKAAQQQRAALLESAQQEAEHRRAEAEAAIARMRGETEARIDRRANMLATDIAAHLLAGPAERLSLAAFLGEFETALAGLPEATRAAIAAPDAKLEIATARPLDEAGRAALGAALARGLGRAAPAYTTRVEPELIAGLRLSADTARVEASLHADLGRVLAGLGSAEAEGHNA